MAMLNRNSSTSNSADSGRYFDTGSANIILPQNLPFNLNGFTDPTLFTCPYCRKSSVSETMFLPGPFTWGYCLLSSFVCICCLPFCVRDLNDIYHQCSICKKRLDSLDIILSNELRLMFCI